MNLPENLIDVLSDESFATERIPGAKNFCVYEVVFLENISRAFPDRNTPLTVYGRSPQTREAVEAAEILKSAGYTQVEILEGGLEGWKARGGTTEGTGSAAGSLDGRYAVNPAESSILWTGRNFFNFHSGTLKPAGGEVIVTGDLPVGGLIPIDMQSMSCSDITDAAMNQLLIDHLRSSDFFDVGRFPLAELAIASANWIPDSTPGQPNMRIQARLTLRGHTHDLNFDLVGARRHDGALVAQGTVQFDRTLWGSIYGSGRFFAGLGKHLVNDLVDLQVKIVATPA